MLALRRANERGETRTDWLQGRHSFSFGGYHDRRHMGYSVLRVLNEDHIAPGAGFDPHPHRDMEIVTYVIDGALSHGDNMGNHSVIHAGEIQRMSAGTGIVHSEHNASDSEPAHILQIWIQPSATGLPPSYEQRPIPPADPARPIMLIASPDGRNGSVTVHQDVLIHLVRLGDGGRADHALQPGRRAYIHLARGEISLNGETLMAGDGAMLADESALQIAAGEGAEALLFDLP